MTLQYIRKTYGVPASRGGQVEYCGQDRGHIVGSRGPYLRVRFIGEKRPRTLHPAYALRYWTGAEWLDPNDKQHCEQRETK